MSKIVLKNGKEYTIALTSPIGKLALKMTFDEFVAAISDFTEDNLGEVQLEINGVTNTYTNMYLQSVVMPDSNGVAFFSLRKTDANKLAEQAQKIESLTQKVAAAEALVNEYRDGYEAAKALLGEE